MSSFEYWDANDRLISTVRLDGSRWLISSSASASHECARGRGSSDEWRRCSRVRGAVPAWQSPAQPPPPRAAEHTLGGEQCCVFTTDRPVRHLEAGVMRELNRFHGRVDDVSAV